MTRTWDLLVVGAGTAGLVGARTAALLGARALLVERDRFGGDCLWTGCVPSKSLIAAASAAAEARDAHRLGVHVEGVRVDGADVLAHVRKAMATIEPEDSADSVRAAGAAAETGDLTFTGPTSAELDGRPLSFRQALVTAGSAPAVPGLPGLAEADPLTSDDFWDLTELPGRMTVLGGGPIGCELAQATARLGVRVTLLEAADRLLSKEDPDAAAVVLEALRRDGVDVRTGTPAERVEGGRDGGRVLLGDGTAVEFDRILVAVGRTPRTRGLGLEAAGVDVDDKGFVVVDDTLRTTNPRIWAAGDVTGHPQFTHLAGVHGSLAAGNAVLGVRRKADLSAVPRVTYTSPEVAAVGEPTGPVEDGRTVVTRQLREVDRAIAEDRTEGFSRLALDRRHRIVGATVVGPRAGEALAELTLAVTRGLTTSDVAGSIHPYPTFADAQWNAAVADARARLTSGWLGRAVAALRWVRRGRLSRG